MLRIVISEDTVTNYLKRDPANEQIEKILRLDDKGQIYYLDYLGNPDIFTSSDNYNMMLQIIKSIIRHGKHTSDSNTFEKYRWLEDYYNTVLDEANKEKNKTNVIDCAETNGFAREEVQGKNPYGREYFLRNNEEVHGKNHYDSEYFRQNQQKT